MAAGGKRGRDAATTDVVRGDQLRRFNDTKHPTAA
jgi:hypothetical protein